MSNHYHLVVYVDQNRLKGFSREEVYERWMQLFRTPPVVGCWRSGAALEAEQRMAEPHREMASSLVRPELVHEVLE